MLANALDHAVPALDELREVVADPKNAIQALSEDERNAYREAQESVVEARRSAEAHEGLLQVN